MGPDMGDARHPDPVVIDCDDCAVRGPGCRDCVVSVLLGTPETLLADERAALEVLADAGLRPGCGWCRSTGPGQRPGELAA